MNRTPYELTLKSQVTDARPEYRFRTADGVVSKQSFRHAELRLLDSLWDRDLGRLLCPQANYGVTGVVLADAAESVEMTETSARAARLCEHNSRQNGVETSVSIRTDLTAIDREFDAVAYAPKRYAPVAVAKQRIADALSSLRPGGSLYLAASAETGLSRYESQLRDVAASVTSLDERDGCRVLEATRPQRVDPPTYVTPRTLRPTVGGETLALTTVPGVFSATGLDDGTRLLIETVTVADGDRVLDLACGYGAVGTYAARTADCEVWLSDDDAVATACAERSLDASGIDGTVVTADCVEGVTDRTFDRVFCNPPTHAGDGVLSELFAGVRDVLAPDGEFAFVRHRELSLRNHLAPFRRVETRRTGTEHVVVTAKP
ncbi:class I SAM-dependent methyltransferase [Halorussus amylolyticus]|uniref:class I SAM-dependent methyltransferase n=1 Tax=Halorussus amylolyticus TaxID=1126242 RepID=UPI001052018E|nr:methyltransferase [Halorussus amylolyticus]